MHDLITHDKSDCLAILQARSAMISVPSPATKNCPQISAIQSGKETAQQELSLQLFNPCQSKNMVHAKLVCGRSYVSTDFGVN